MSDAPRASPAIMSTCILLTHKPLPATPRHIHLLLRLWPWIFQSIDALTVLVALSLLKCQHKPPFHVNQVSHQQSPWANDRLGATSDTVSCGPAQYKEGQFNGLHVMRALVSISGSLDPRVYCDFQATHHNGTIPLPQT